MCLLQNCDLPGVIELVLRDALKHVIEVVALAGHGDHFRRSGHKAQATIAMRSAATRISQPESIRAPVG